MDFAMRLEGEIMFTNELLKFVPGKQYVIMAFDLTREGCATAFPRYSFWSGQV